MLAEFLKKMSLAVLRCLHISRYLDEQVSQRQHPGAVSPGRLQRLAQYPCQTTETATTYPWLAAVTLATTEDGLASLEIFTGPGIAYLWQTGDWEGYRISMVDSWGLNNTPQVDNRDAHSKSLANNRDRHNTQQSLAPFSLAVNWGWNSVFLAENRDGSI